MARARRYRSGPCTCKYIGLIGLMLVGFFIAALYLRATATGFQWGRASRWSQFALIVCAVTVVLTMVTMGYTRRRPARVDNDPGYLIYNCITLEQELTPPESCPAGDSMGDDGSARLVATGVSLGSGSFVFSRGLA